MNGLFTTCWAFVICSHLYHLICNIKDLPEVTCVCIYTYTCPNSQQVTTMSSPLTVSFQRYNSGDFGEPTTHGRVGLSFTGGGAMACCMTTGVLRALYTHSLLQDSIISHVSATSGGAWATTSALLDNADGTTPPLHHVLAPLYVKDLRAFTLEVATTPVSLVSAMVVASRASFLARSLGRLVLTSSDTGTDADNSSDSAHDHSHWWALAFGDTCLQQLNLYRPNVRSLFMNTPRSRHDAHVTVPQACELQAVHPLIIRKRPGVPIPVTQFTMVTNGRCVLSVPDLQYMDMSPYTTGFACLHANTRTATNYRVGGRITTEAFGAVLLDECKHLATLGTFSMNACTMAGMTSDVPAALMSQRPILSSLLRDKVPTVHQSVSPCNRVIRVVDGAVIDNSGIYGLLARQLSHIVMVIYAPQPLVTAAISTTLSALFGKILPAQTPYQPVLMPVGYSAQVFESHRYDSVIAELYASMLGGTRTGVATFRSFPVQGNAKHGIPAYVLKSLMIVYAGRDEAFLLGLPRETRDALLVDNPNFPHYDVFDVTRFVHMRPNFMSTIGSNGLARYAQYVAEKLIVQEVSSMHYGA